jgi:Domain of unknown function (DUF1992)
VTERKPPGISWESWIDRQIRVGMEEGAFDDLPGNGKPVRDLDRPRDEMWWVRDKLKRENIEYLPPTLQVRKEFDRALERIAAAGSEAEVREVVAEINARVRWVNSRVTAGPPSTVAPLDAEAEVEAWRAGPAGQAAAATAAAREAEVADPRAGDATASAPTRLGTTAGDERRPWWRRPRRNRQRPV